LSGDNKLKEITNYTLFLTFTVYYYCTSSTLCKIISFILCKDRPSTLCKNRLSILSLLVSFLYYLIPFFYWFIPCFSFTWFFMLMQISFLTKDATLIVHEYHVPIINNVMINEEIGRRKCKTLITPNFTNRKASFLCVSAGQKAKQQKSIT